MPVYDEKYIKTKIREFNVVINKNFLGDDIPKENVHYACIACPTIDSVMRMEKKVYLEECKYKIKKTKMANFIKAGLDSESESHSESETELESKSELESGTE